MGDLILGRVGAQALDRVRAVEQVFDDLLTGSGSHAFEQAQDTVPGNGVLRISEHAHMREQVFDMRGFHELKTAPFHKRDVVARQLDFQVERMKARAEQDGDIPKRDTLFAQLENFLADKLRLHLLAGGLYELGSGADALTSE